jgi:hypothetical protein
MSEEQISEPDMTVLQECRAFLDEVSRGQRRTTLNHVELMLIATFVSKGSTVTE